MNDYTLLIPGLGSTETAIESIRDMLREKCTGMIEVFDYDSRGLSNTPVIQLDDGKSQAYIGPLRKNVVDAEKKVDFDGQSVSVPLDVFGVGRDQLTAFGVSAEKQNQMFQKWRTLPKNQQEAYTQSWDSLDKNDSTALQGFLQGMIDALS
ncbi:hypothetical protein KFL_010640030 [Klebsormidium nitens]|uniref:Uncharacterized protein n=1 Tax=Klebsormidium nitens TaxID=105231 RepID=A0A1Y1INZ2_KLENI|nr:hypothetical protein KFL_010640030 [Klebsormidium nitens]|eukprot:GAQ92590.1 hypothetical protein KFL_010640030 [Klebsormidium nitens]